jgi:hypothetical protein
MAPATVQAMALATARHPVMARPVPIIAASVSGEDITGPAGSGAGMDASRAGPCRTVSANPIGATSSAHNVKFVGAGQPAHARVNPIDER